MTRTVGVIATPATFQSEVYASVVERFAFDVTVLHQPCPGLVEQIEAGEFSTPRTEEMLRAWLDPMIEKGIDALVLGCTHYPLVRPLIEKILGAQVRVIDPAPAVARQVVRLLDQYELRSKAESAGDPLVCYTSGSPALFEHMLNALGMHDRTPVLQGEWIEEELTLP